MHAFDGIASVRPIGNWGWGNLMTFAYYHPCVSIDGYRVTLEQVDAKRAGVIIEGDGRGSGGGEHPKPEPIQTPWTLGLVKTDHGWRIEVAILTAYDLTLQYVTGDHLWWQACVSEEELPPALFAYKLADEASSYHRSYERCARAIDHAEAFAREGLAPNVVAFCAAARTRLAWSEEHYSEAAALGREAVAVSRTIGDPDSVALALFALGLAQWKNDEVPAALQSLDDAVSMREQLASRHMAFRSQLLIAYIHLYQHEYREAIAASRKAVELSEAAQWHEGIIQGNLDLAEVHSDLRDFEAARRYGDLALALARKDHARGPTLQGLQIIAGCDISLERGNDVEAHFREPMHLTPIISRISPLCAPSSPPSFLRLL